MHLYSAHLAGWAAPADVFTQFYSAAAYAFWLDRESHATEPFTVMGAGAPVKAAEAELLAIADTAARLGFSGNCFGEFGAELPFGWRPGLVGALTYEASESNIFMYVDRAIVFDHRDKSMFFVGIFASQDAFDLWHRAALLRLTMVGGQQAIYRDRHRANQVTSRSVLRHQPEPYLERIRQAQRHIAAGDVYQICLTNEISFETSADPLFTFLELRQDNPAPYSTYLKLDKTAVVSSSPEQFLRVDKDGSVSTKPIKGTRGRGADELADQQIIFELRHNHKERAENLMIVDLMRNDLSKVSEINSVSVPKLFEVESYATVHQLVSTVTAKKLAESSVVDVLSAAFPGGSMTGAPKLRAMEIIADLEDGQRGVYSGAIGYIGVDGSADFGMTIRTLIFDGQSAKLGVGGGITSDSDPMAELEETKLKAQALLRVLNAPNPWL